MKGKIEINRIREKGNLDMKEINDLARLILVSAAVECWPASFETARIVYLCLWKKLDAAYRAQLFWGIKKEILETWRETDRGFEFEITLPGAKKD